MNLAIFSIEKRTFTMFCSLILALAGGFAYFQLGRLEDPEFTVKTALIVTRFPGATVHQVEELVTDKIEKAVRQLPETKRTRSLSRPGVSMVYLDIKDEYRSQALSQIWDKLHRKIVEIAPSLPDGAETPIVRDDFGDVYGILLAVTGDGYSYAELKKYVDFLQKELSLVKDVSRAETWGEQREVIFIEISSATLARLGMPPNALIKQLQVQNLVLDAGAIEVGRERIRISPSGEFNTVDEIGNLLVRASAEKLIFLKDIAKIERGYYTPPQNVMRFNGMPAIALALSIVPRGNVMRMGEAVKARIDELLGECPVGINIDVVSYQPDTVKSSIDDFVSNLIESVVIVILTLLVSMGLRSGLLIGFGLVFTILVTFIVMQMAAIDMQRVSLGALIIALGMLVDNAIVVTELMLVKMQQGIDRVKAAGEAADETGMPLLGATLIGVFAFFPIFVSKHSSGEYCASLFYVVGISLLASWILAVTFTPVTCYYFLKVAKEQQGTDPYRGWIYRGYQAIVEACIQYRLLTLAALAVLLAMSIFGFQSVKRAFFPESTRQQFLVDYWLPEGSRIQNVAEDLQQVEKFLLGKQGQGVTSVATFIGSAPPRFYLPLEPELPSACFGQLVVNIGNAQLLDTLVEQARAYIGDNLPYAEYRVRKFPMGVPTKFKVEVRFSGKDALVLKNLASQAEAILRGEPETMCVRNDWRQRVKLVKPNFSQPQANRVIISRYDMALSLKRAYDGLPIGVYREGDNLLPVIVRPPERERMDVSNLTVLPVWGSVTAWSVPLSQIVSGTIVEWDESLICRRDRKRTISVQCDVKKIQASQLVQRVRARIEAIPLPEGYSMAWGGEAESSREAQEALSKGIPLSILIMAVILVALFNSLIEPAIILITVPLAMIGVTFGLVVMDQPFGFMALLGALSLSGMIIKNTIVLIDKIDAEMKDGLSRREAVIRSSVARFRPVMLTALTTIFGMLPLAFDAGFYQPMAVAIMFGLTFATVLTLLVVPVLCSYRLGREK